MQHDALSHMVGCSVYEFSRIFSFMAGMSVSEYIRRRRLSQAVFDIQNSSEKIIDIALKYCYESPTTFARAFKELHGTTPLSARKTSVILKTYPPIAFILTVKGVNELKHRIEKRDCMGLEHKGLTSLLIKDSKLDELGIPIYNAAYWVPHLAQSAKSIADSDPKFLVRMKKLAAEDGCEDNWEEWHAKSMGNVALIEYNVSAEGGTTVYLGRISEITDPQVIEAIQPPIVITDPEEIAAAMGRTLDDTLPTAIMKPTNPLTKIPAATWAVFTFDMEMTEQSLSEAYTRILTEWMPISGYKRDESAPHMEQYEAGDKTWEIWIPVVKK